MATGKRFGVELNDDTPDTPDVPFTAVFVRDDKEEDHDFLAQPDISYGDVVGFQKLQRVGADQGQIVVYLDRVIRRSLRNDDGVPVKWRPEIAAGEFTTPAGETAPVADLEKFTAFAAGSSRRRWMELVDSDDAVIGVQQVMGIFEYLTESIAARPTPRSSRSSR